MIRTRIDLTDHAGTGADKRLFQRRAGPLLYPVKRGGSRGGGNPLGPIGIVDPGQSWRVLVQCFASPFPGERRSRIYGEAGSWAWYLPLPHVPGCRAWLSMFNRIYESEL